MASLDGFKQYITGATGSQGVLGPQASWRAFVLPRGAHASQSSTGTLITFDSASAASRFTANRFIQVGLNVSNIRQVTAVGGNSLSVNSAVTVSSGDRIYHIGTTEPVVSGNSTTYQPHTTIYSRDDNGSTPVTNSMLTSDANGGFEFFTTPNFYDLLIQDSNRSLQTSLVDVSIGAFSGLTVSDGSAYFGSTVTIGSSTELVVLGWTNSDLATGVNRTAVRVGGRASNTGGAGERYLVYASESYTSDLAADNETTALYGINLYSGNIADSADAHGVFGIVQYNPTTNKTSTPPMIGVGGTAQYGGTHPSATCTALNGGVFQARTGTGATGTITSMRVLQANQPQNNGTAAIGNVISLFVQGASANFTTTTQNQIANFTGGDDNNTFLIRGAPVRWDDSFNNGNAAAAGRMFDFYKTIVGDSSLTTLYAPLHLQAGLSGTFTSGDDVAGIRSLVRTETASGAGKNLDQVTGFRADLDHRSNQLVDEVYGYQANVTASGSSANPIVNTMAGLDVNLTATGVSVVNVYGAIVRSLTPAVGFSSAGHIRLVPVSTATPATTLATMTGAQDGTMIFITDSNHADNSGLYIRINSKWLCLVSGQSDFRIATDA